MDTSKLVLNKGENIEELEIDDEDSLFSRYNKHYITVKNIEKIYCSRNEHCIDCDISALCTKANIESILK